MATNIIGTDINGVEPEMVCQDCVKLVENTNKEFRTDEKIQSNIKNYSADNNYKDKLKQERKARPVFQHNNTFLPHDDESCEICDQDPDHLEAFAKSQEETPLTNIEVEFI